MNTENQRRNRILVITYVFPPVAYVGVHRTLKYCRYLGAHGWVPVVLTAKPGEASFNDGKLCEQIPADVEVYRSLDFDPAKWLDILYRRKRRAQTVATEPAQVVTNHATLVKPDGVMSRLKSHVLALLLKCPDSHVFWVPFAVLKGSRILLGSRKVDVIYSTSPPHSSHLVALLLAKLFRLPYVIDFRDSWYVNGSVRPSQNTIPWLCKLETRTKRAIVRGAARIICVSKGECAELQAEFPGLKAEHFTFITNGYDPADQLADENARQASPRLSLIHAGTIYPGIAGEFFAALQHLLATDPNTTQALEVHLLGEIAEEYLAVARQLEDRGLVKIHGMQPHARTLQLLQASDVAVILMGGTKYLSSHLPSKFYEYLHVGKPILAIAQEGELTAMATQSGLGMVVPPHDIEKVVQAIRDLMEEHRTGHLARVPNLPYIQSFARPVLAEQLATILDEVMEARRVRQ